MRRLNTGVALDGLRAVCDALLSVTLAARHNNAEVDLKVEQWLQAGARLVWVVNPRTRKVVVHTPGEVLIRSGSDVLDGGEVLPGFSCPVAEIFG